MKFDIEKAKLLILLIITDLVFVFLHILFMYTDLVSNSNYALYRDRGYAEFFQYTKELWVAILLFSLAIKKRRMLYLVFSSLFFYFLVDDAVELHEQVGEFLANYFGFQPALGLRDVDFGELIVAAVLGLVFAIAIAAFYFRSHRSARRVALYLASMTVLLAGFGVVVDMIDIMVPHQGASDVLMIVEDGGEMLVMSLITWFVFHLNFYNEEIPFSLSSWERRLGVREVDEHSG